MFQSSAAVAAAAAQQANNGFAFVSGESSRDVKEEIFRRQATLAMQNNINLLPIDAELLESIPERVQDYTDLYPLKRISNIAGKSSLVSNVFGFVTTTYKAININTNQTVCLKRVHSYQPAMSNQKSLMWLIDSWKKAQCSTLVRLLQVFTTKDFGDNSLVFVYQYFPQATTMMQQYFNDPQSAGHGPGANSIFGSTNRPYSQQHAILKNRLLPENLLWHYVIQLSSSLRLIHTLGFAFRALEPSKILITTPIPKGPPSQMMPSQYPRVRLNNCGLFDIVANDYEVHNRTSNPKEFYQQLQSDDLVAFGQLLLALATNSLASTQRTNWETSLEQITRAYSPDLKALIVSLLSIKQQTLANRRTINDIMPMIGARFYVQLNLSYEALDNAQAEIEREALNGKLFRLLVKLSMINDRPELRMDPTWSETGDRYMLKLFREYLFHQVTEDGTPWLDCGHVVSTLIKFDAASPEKICLISRDGQHVLVVSYAELKKCFESALTDLQS